MYKRQTLRNIIGDLELDQTLTSRDIINSKMRMILDEATDPWGIKINRVELKNIMPPKEIQDSMEKPVSYTHLGAIGSRVCSIAKAFGCDVIAYSRTEKEEIRKMGVKYVPLKELLETSDIVSLHVPATSETNKLIGKNEIGLMKKNAVLINTARGAVVDSSALAQALESGAIAGAGIDVFEGEPPIDKNHPILNCKNTVITPHVAFASDEALYARAGIVVENIIKWENGSVQNLIC